MAQKISETLPTFDKHNNLTGSQPMGGKTGIPTPGMMSLIVQFDTTDLPIVQNPIDVAHQKYMEHLELVVDHTTSEQQVSAQTPAEELIYLMTQASTTDLDDIQLGDVYRLCYNSLKKLTPKPLAPTDDQWRTWLAEMELKINGIKDDYSDEQRSQFMDLLNKAKASEKPDALSYALLTKIGNKVIAARLSLDEGYKQISAWFDCSPVDVKWAVARFRKEYLEAESQGDLLLVDKGYSKGYKMTSGSGPKDVATVYGHMMAENPELYDPSAIPTRFVAFDTETTGFLDDPNTKIVQVGLVEYDHDGNETRRFVSYVRPPLDENGELSTGSAGAIATHGILPEHVKDSPEFQDLVSTLKEFFDGATVIGQNVISFDQKMLSREYVRAANGDKTAGYNAWPRAADTLWYAQRHIDIDALGLENRKLETLNNHLGLGAFDAHDAGADAHVSAKIFFHIRKQLKERQLAAFKQRKENDEWTI